MPRDSDITLEERFSGNEGSGILKIGYRRRVDLRWQWGVELNFNWISDLSMSKQFEDYHQTSTSFEYIENNQTHNFSAYLDIPMYVKYQPINSRFGFLAGVEIGYAHDEAAYNSFRTAGENEIINPLKEWTNADQHLKNFDFGVFAGATFRIWRGLEFEWRYNLGLNDISHDNYWGPGRHTTTCLLYTSPSPRD